MGILTFDQVVKQLKGKAILVANRGIPARRICRSVRERFDATAVLTATDVDKASPAAAAAQELFATLRSLDDAGVRLIWIETPPDTPDWEGVRDRLQRAAA